MNRLSKTGIEYGDLSWNFYPGCLHKPQGKCPVSGCWAEGMYKRQMGAAKKGIILPDFHHPHLIPELLLAPLSVKKPARILVNFMGDLFGDWIDPNEIVHPEDAGQPNKYSSEARNWSLQVLIRQVISDCPQHTFIFLTKNPAGLAAWSPFPDNCWVGVSATNWMQFSNALGYLAPVQLKAKVKFISFEPLLERIEFDMMQKMLFRSTIQWIILGQQTPAKASTTPKIEWAQEIALAATKANVPLFIKDNLKSLLPNRMPFWCPVSWRENGVTMTENRLRQEFPKES